MRLIKYLHHHLPLELTRAEYGLHRLAELMLHVAYVVDYCSDGPQELSKTSTTYAALYRAEHAALEEHQRAEYLESGARLDILHLAAD